MATLQRLKSTIPVLNSNKLAVLDVKAGTTQRIRGRAWMDTRKAVLLRDGYKCQCCGIVRADNEVDHLVPLEQGGSNDITNMQTLCGGPDGCHTRKSASEATARARG